MNEPFSQYRYSCRGFSLENSPASIGKKLLPSVLGGETFAISQTVAKISYNYFKPDSQVKGREQLVIPNSVNSEKLKLLVFVNTYTSSRVIILYNGWNYSPGPLF